VVNGGTALNIVPDACWFEFEFRTIAADDAGALVDEVRAYARTLEPAMQRIAPQAGIAFEEKSGFPGLETPAGAALVGLTQELAGANDLAKVAYGTEAGLFAAAGIPSVVIGPGSIDQAHKADEFVAESELAKCGAFLDRLLARCGGAGA
jgi:acetylornithine deacetylase